MTFASVGELIKKVQAELYRIDDGTPPIPELIEKRLGMRAPQARRALQVRRKFRAGC